MEGTIWWEDLCGNSSLHSAFWSPELTLETYNPDFTLCMQKSLLLWIPAGFLLLFSLSHIYTLCKLKTLHGVFDFSRLNFIKLLLCLLMIVVSLVNFGITINRLVNQKDVQPVDITYDVIQTLTLMLATWLTRLEYMKGVTTSSQLSIFWALYGVSEVLIFRSAIIRKFSQTAWMQSDADFGLEVTFFFLLLSELLASFFADTAALKPAHKITNRSDEKIPLLSGVVEVKLKKDGRPVPTPVPEIKSSFWMKATFQWMWPAILRGNKKTIKLDDVYDIRAEDKCTTPLKIFYEFFTKAKVTESTSWYAVRRLCARALFEAMFWPLIWGFSMKVLSTFTFLISPQILSLMLTYIGNGDIYTWKAWVLGFLLFAVGIVGAMARHGYYYLGWNAGLKARSIVNAAVCRKALQLSEGSKKTTTVGEMVNLLAVDAQKIQDMVIYTNTFLDIPLHVILGLLCIWLEVGWACLAGIGVMAVLLPLNVFVIANQSRKLQAKQMVHKDNRLRMVNEILNGIKILKLYAWEPSFMAKTEAHRDGEMHNLRWSNRVIALLTVNLFIMPYMMSLAIFAMYVMTSTDYVLSPQTAFVTLAYINSFQIITSGLPMAVTYIGQGIVSIGRIGNFLAMEDLNQTNIERDSSISGALKMEDASFAWESEDRVTTLQNINLEVKCGELVAVVGQVGAGKSSLLSAILGEITKVKGYVKVNGGFAYVSQQPWIQNATLRDNILFDSQYVHKKYKAVMEACALNADLKTLPGADFTEIGEKGINMSGGQKARISLARAVYQDEDIYLLDDPLSAVDAHVGKHIFEKVIGKKGILRHKTRILVTHAISFLPQADKIIVLKDGQVTEMGHYEDLLENNGAFAEYLRTYLVEEGIDDDSSASEFLELHQKLSAMSVPESEPEIESSQTPKLRHRRKKLADHTLSQSVGTSVTSASTHQEDTSRLIEQEMAFEGKLSYQVILAYIKAGGFLSFFTVLFSLLVFSGSQVLTNIWLSDWTNDIPTNGTFTLEHVSYRLGVYGGFGILQTVAAFSLMMAVGDGCTKASKDLHKSLLYGIMRAPMSFFYTTPLGRVMNRFSKDMDMVDANVPIFLMNWMFAVSPLICTVVLISYTTPIFLAFMVVIAIPYAFIQRLYITYASQLKRLESIQRSPIYAHFEETVNGASSIRAYGREMAFIERGELLIDNSQRPFYVLSAAQRWLGVTMETLGAIVVFCAAVLAALQTDSMAPGLAGMSVSYAIQLTAVLSTMVRGATELETYMISVERIDEYRNVNSEAPLELPDDERKHLRTWPNEGALSFYEYGCRYRPGLDLVLQGINLNIVPGQKVGVVGRTGAGKSSLTLALFRIIEAAEGQITIDGEDISKLGLHKLRSRLTVIPQDPVMFSGSLRMNLDPAHDYSEHDIWEALEHAHLKSFVQGHEEQLDYNCGEGGDALSIGQRQLVCLARALLRKSKVLILDEATAAVDLETDALIQASIRKHFNQCTVLTVAHRLNTVLDYDRILVLDKGKVKEFDSPTNLLAAKKSVFYSLAKEAGLV